MTRDRLIDAAEELFAIRGVDAVSMREVNRHAGQRNASALQYHFGNRDGLLAAVLGRHRDVMDVRHHELLDACDRSRPELWALVDALVRPFAERLATVSGRRFVVVQAEVVQRFTPDSLGRIDLTEHSGFDRWRLSIEAVLTPDALAAHTRLTAVQIAYLELANWIRRTPGFTIETAPSNDGRLAGETDRGIDREIDRARDRVAALVGAVLASPVCPPEARDPMARACDRSL